MELSKKTLLSKDLLFGKRLSIWKRICNNDGLFERTIVLLLCFQKRAVNWRETNVESKTCYWGRTFC